MLSSLATIAARHTSDDPRPTAIPNLMIWTAQAPTAPCTGLFEPRFYLLVQGRKRVTFAGEAFDCGPGACAIASVGLPFTSEIVEASLDAPYIGISLRVEETVVADLLLGLPEAEEPPLGAFSVAEAESSVVEPLHRLLLLLDTPSEIGILASQFEREVCYRLLQGPLGGRLRQFGRLKKQFGQIRTAADWIVRNAGTSMSVEWLAAHVGMSITSFHRHFKAITSYSPLAYQRHVRLSEARRRLATGSISVTETAFASGYASAPQFSREYKRFFGVSPKQHSLMPV